MLTSEPAFANRSGAGTPQVDRNSSARTIPKTVLGDLCVNAYFPERSGKPVPLKSPNEYKHASGSSDFVNLEAQRRDLVTRVLSL